MKHLVKHTLSFFLVFCIMLCFPVSAAEEDDLLSHYNGSEKDYCDYLTNVFAEQYPYTWDCYTDELVGPEMVRLFDAYYTDIHHPYLMPTEQIHIFSFSMASQSTAQARAKRHAEFFSGSAREQTWPGRALRFPAALRVPIPCRIYAWQG